MVPTTLIASLARNSAAWAPTSRTVAPASTESLATSKTRCARPSGRSTSVEAIGKATPLMTTAPDVVSTVDAPAGNVRSPAAAQTASGFPRAIAARATSVTSTEPSDARRRAPSRRRSASDPGTIHLPPLGNGRHLCGSAYETRRYAAPGTVGGVKPQSCRAQSRTHRARRCPARRTEAYGRSMGDAAARMDDLDRLLPAHER